MKSIKYIICCCVMIVFATTAFAQESSLSERESELTYSRAYEAVMWAVPVIQSMQIKKELFEKSGENYCTGYRPSSRMATDPRSSSNHTGFRCVKNKKI